MEIRALLSAMWRSKTGPLLVAAQVALTLAVVVNMAYIVRQRLENAGLPTGLDLNNMFWITTQASTADYNYPAAVKADLRAYLNSRPGVLAATTSSNLPQTWSTTWDCCSPRIHRLSRPPTAVSTAPSISGPTSSLRPWA